MHETAAPAVTALWPPDDTEWSVVGSDLHQGTITDACTGINEAAVGDPARRRPRSKPAARR